MSNENYYQSIKDIILYNWWKLQEGKIEYSRKDIAHGNKRNDVSAFIEINDSYIQEFGIDKTQLEIIELQRRIAILECDFVIDEDRFFLNEIKRLEKEIIELLTNNKGGTDRDGLVIHLEKWLGFKIDEKKITANKFYKIVREFEKEAEMMRKAHA